MGALDRSAFAERLANNAVSADVDLVTLPSCGDQVYLRTSVNADMVRRAYVAAGNDDDRPLVAMPNLLKFVLVDEDGDPLPRSFAEARGWFASLDNTDAVIVLERLQVILEQAREAGDAETPKGS